MGAAITPVEWSHPCSKFRHPNAIPVRVTCPQAPAFRMDFFNSVVGPTLYNAYTGWLHSVHCVCLRLDCCDAQPHCNGVVGHWPLVCLQLPVTRTMNTVVRLGLCFKTLHSYCSLLQGLPWTMCGPSCCATPETK